MLARVMRSTAIQYRLGDVLEKHLAAANLLGRVQIVRDVHRKTGKVVPIATSSRMPVRFDDGGDDLSLGFSLKLPADGSANYLRGLTPVTKDTYDGLSAQYKGDAFTVAGVSDVRLIEKVRDELADVMKHGGTEADFDAAVAKLTGEAGVASINAFTLDTVFTTNMQKAYSLGRYEQMVDPAVVAALPFWQYMTVGDDHVRPEHAVLDGFVARAAPGDPVWNKIYPPNGFNCRCIVIALLAEEAFALDKDASEPGYARLPLLAKEKVPQAGFLKPFKVAA